MAETNVKSDRGVKVNMSTSGEPHVDVIFKGIPLNLWEKWDKDCTGSYHDIRWLKLWSDNLIAQSKLSDRDELVEKVMERINFKMEEAQVAPVEDDDEVRTLSGSA